jgi:two-component sensor histidine kinase
LIASYEFSFDDFHPDCDRIFCVDAGMRGGHWNCVPGPMPAAMRREMTGFQTVAAFQTYAASVTIPEDQNGKPKSFDDDGSLVIAEPQYFDIFRYRWLSKSIGIVHQKLYQGENLGAIEMKDYFINLSESILDSFGAHKRVQVECTMNALNVDVETAVPLGLIVNELLTNTIKCAFPEGRSGKVQITLEQASNGSLRMLISDNGVGKSGTVKGTGFGGQLVSLLTQQLGGTMKEENDNGTHIFFEFKLAKAA